MLRRQIHVIFFIILVSILIINIYRIYTNFNSYKVAQDHAERGKYDRAVEEYKRDSRFETSLGLLQWMNRNVNLFEYIRRGSWNKAVKTIEGYNEIPRSILRLDSIYLKLAFINSDLFSEEFYEKLIALDPNFFSFLIPDSVLAKYKGKIWDSTYDLFFLKNGELVEMGDGEREYTLGLAFEKIDLLDQAIQVYKRAIPLIPDPRKVYDRLSYIYYIKGDLDRKKELDLKSREFVPLHLDKQKFKIKIPSIHSNRYFQEIGIFPWEDKIILWSKIYGGELERGDNFVEDPFVEVENPQGDTIVKMLLYRGRVGSYKDSKRGPVENSIFLSELPLDYKVYLGYEYSYDNSNKKLAGGPLRIEIEF